MVLKKELTLYDRDETGELIPKEVKLVISKEDDMYDELKDETIFVTPMARGEIRKLFASVSADADKDLDGDLILKHCHQPKYDKSEIPHIKPSLATAIVNTIFNESGVATGDKKSRKNAMQDAEDDFAKN